MDVSDAEKKAEANKQMPMMIQLAISSGFIISMVLLGQPHTVLPQRVIMRFKGFDEKLLLLLHERFLFWILVVVAAKMQDTMNE